MTAPYLSVDALSFTYEGARAATLASVSATFPRGAVVAVVGPQGCGKTTLMRGISGLLGAIYSGTVSGTVTVPAAEGRRPADGSDVSAFFESFAQVTLTTESVSEEISLPLLAEGWTEEARQAAANAIAAQLRIEYLLNRSPTALSGGEEKLVGLAATLCAQTPIVVLDEPFEQLDVDHVRAMVKAIRVRARAGALVLVATSAVDIAVNMADLIWIHDEGAWRVEAVPSYSVVAGAGELGETEVLSFLRSVGASPDLSMVRHYRDAVTQARGTAT